MRSKSKHQNLCAICGGQLKDTTITHAERRGSQLYLFQNVPAQVCTQCGEIGLRKRRCRKSSSSSNMAIPCASSKLRCST